jgi:hypothetical protein
MKNFVTELQDGGLEMGHAHSWIFKVSNSKFMFLGP